MLKFNTAQHMQSSDIHWYLCIWNIKCSRKKALKLTESVQDFYKRYKTKFTICQVFSHNNYTCQQFINMLIYKAQQQYTTMMEKFEIPSSGGCLFLSYFRISAKVIFSSLNNPPCITYGIKYWEVLHRHYTFRMNKKHVSSKI